MKTLSLPRKTVKFSVLRNEKGVMSLSLLPSFWERVALRQASKVIVAVIDQLSDDIRSQGPFVIPPILWKVEVNMPMLYGFTHVVVTPI